MQKVSVIVPTYNSSEFIEATLNSIIEQNYPNLEIIVSDDASIDNTVAIIQSFCEKFSFIKLIVNEKNQGVTKNCNVALKACTGKYIGFIGADDLMLPGKLIAQVNYMEHHPDCSISYHNVEVFDSTTDKCLYYYNSWFKNKARSGKVDQLLKYGCFNSACSTLIKANKLPPHGHNENFPVASDWLLSIETLLFSGGTIDYIPYTYARYRRHQKNVTSSGSIFYKQAIIDSLNVSVLVAVNYPQYVIDTLGAYAIHLRLIRRLHESSKGYRQALIASLKVKYTLLALIALVCNWVTFGKVRL